MDKTQYRYAVECDSEFGDVFVKQDFSSLEDAKIVAIEKGRQLGDPGIKSVVVGEFYRSKNSEYFPTAENILELVENKIHSDMTRVHEYSSEIDDYVARLAAISIDDLKGLELIIAKALNDIFVRNHINPDWGSIKNTVNFDIE